MNIKDYLNNSLIKTQQYTKTDNVYVAKHGLWLTFGQIFSLLISLALAWLFANFLSQEIYGTYKYVLSIVNLLIVFTLPGIATSVNRAVSQGKEGSFVRGLKAQIYCGMLGGVMSLLLAIYHYFAGNSTLAIAFAITSAFIPLMEPFGLYEAFWMGRKRFDVQTKNFVLIRLGAVVLISSAVFFTGNLFIVLLSYFFAYTLFRFIALWIVLKRKIKKNAPKDTRVVSYGRHLTIIESIDTIAESLDRILLYHYLGPAEVAIYSFAILPCEQFKAFLKNIKSLAFPKFSQNTEQNIKRTILSKTIILVTFIGFCVAIYIIFAPYLYKFFLKQYVASIPYSRLFSLSLMASGMGLLAHTALRAQAAKKRLYQLTIFSSVAQIVLLFLLISQYGIWGAIISRVVGRSITSFTSLWLIKRGG